MARSEWRAQRGALRVARARSGPERQRLILARVTSAPAAPALRWTGQRLRKTSFSPTTRSVEASYARPTSAPVRNTLTAAPRTPTHNSYHPLHCLGSWSGLEADGIKTRGLGRYFVKGHYREADVMYFRDFLYYLCTRQQPFDELADAVFPRPT